jgi:hypothetical protein
MCYFLENFLCLDLERVLLGLLEALGCRTADLLL